MRIKQAINVPLLSAAFITWLLAGPAYAESPDGTEITPQVLWSSEGFWNFAWPWDAENWFLNLNGAATNGIGSRLVYAGGLVYTVGRDRNWWVWYSGWYRSAPPPLPRPPPTEAVLRVPEVHATLRTAISEANADKSGKYYVIQIAPGTYTNEFVEINRPMTLRATAGGPVVLQATVVPSNGKALIVANASLEVDGLTFTGARNGFGNGAGIRDHNLSADGKLTIRNSIFTLNDTGVLTDNRSPDMTITVENSKFIDNGSPSIANPHALYVNSGKLLKISGSLFCGQLRGHNVKSRAAATEIIDSKLYDGAADPAVGCDRAGSTGRAVDIANGGVAMISGNQIIQGTGSPQFQMMAYGLEGLPYSANTLVITHNTFASPGTPHSTMLFDPYCIHVRPGSLVADNVYDHIRTIFNPANCQ